MLPQTYRASWLEVERVFGPFHGPISPKNRPVGRGGGEIVEIGAPIPAHSVRSAFTTAIYEENSHHQKVYAARKV